MYENSIYPLIDGCYIKNDSVILQNKFYRRLFLFLVKEEYISYPSFLHFIRGES